MKKRLLSLILVALLVIIATETASADANLPSWSNFTQMQEGSSGLLVRAICVVAKYYNPSSISVGTSFDGTIKNAVIKFQKNMGFSKKDQDGIVGPKTWTAMHSVLGGKTRITGSGTGNGSPSSSGGYYGYKVYQKSSGSYTSLFYFRTDVNHPNWLDVYKAAPGSTPGTWYWVVN
jgi:peptidoglycan hydrolase-like protein with peptidoglycan-binding domain